MQDRWAVISSGGEWARDEAGRVMTFVTESQARELCSALIDSIPGAGWMTEVFTVEDALDEMANSPFSSEGGL